MVRGSGAFCWLCCAPAHRSSTILQRNKKGQPLTPEKSETSSLPLKKSASELLMNLLSHPSGESGYNTADMQIWAGVGTFWKARQKRFALIWVCWIRDYWTRFFLITRKYKHTCKLYRQVAMFKTFLLLNIEYVTIIFVGVTVMVLNIYVRNISGPLHLHYVVTCAQYYYKPIIHWIVNEYYNVKENV